jgi:multidrug resistance efflux pump
MNLFPPSPRVLGLLVVLAVCVGTSIASVLLRKSSWTQPTTAASPPASQESPGVTCFGRVDLEHGITSLCALQPGRVAEVLVEENQAVAAGAVLLRLDDELARGRLAEAEAALEAAQLQLARARKMPALHRSRIVQQQAALDAMRYRLSAARRALARKEELARSSQIDEQEVAISQDQIKELQALERGEEQRLADLQAEDPQEDIRRAEKEVAATRARVRQARTALNDCQVKAPKAGSVLRLLVGVGDVLSAAPQQPSVLFAGDGPQVIRAEVEQEFAGRVAEKQPVVVEDESAAGVRWHGRVRRIANWYSQRRTVLYEPFQLTDVRTVECLIALDPGQRPLRFGQRVRVLIGAVRPVGAP